ncbi:MAG: hypothetical protein HGA19_01425 [Oscillochloris sp.]|nr:hypothetical protein [Oscillochloris sp.]
MITSTIRTRPTAPSNVATSPHMPLYYVPIPRRMVEDLRDTPVALAAFALVARIFRATREPVVISPRDLQIFDPVLSYGSAFRALKRLRETGWLLATDIGRKKAFTPTWGLISGNTRPWDLEAASLGRPRHINTLRLDQRLLDICIGRLTPNPHHPALVRRYFKTPLLGLMAIGDYTMALAGISVHSRILEDLHLLSNGQALPLPDNTTIFAIASQRETIGLTPAGWAQTPFPPPAAAPAPPSSGQALFFVPVDQIGPMIGEVIADVIADMIGDQSSDDQEISASESAEDLIEMQSLTSHVVMEKNESTTHARPTKTVEGGEGGGGKIQQDHAEQPTKPVHETSRLLQEIGVRRSVATSLADREPSQVSRLIAQARARLDVRDIAAWVVAALRDLPDEPIALPPAPVRVSEGPILFHSGISGYQRQIWLSRFRAALPGDRQAILDRFIQEVGHDPVA